jgi:alanine-synthesizing transaminase
VTFSSRLPDRLQPNAVSLAIEALRASGVPLVDLTESNPTHVGLPYPPGLLTPLSGPRALLYEPAPLGLWSAREAVAADAWRRGGRVDPADVVLTASTSESYAWLFKLLCDPGDCVLVPRPSYPLFEHLTRLEVVHAVPYDLEYHRRWTIDFARIEDAPVATRAVLLVSPNNPTGSFISTSELDRLAALCARRGWALIADEVFSDYVLDEGSVVTDLASRVDVLSFTLGGASKSLGLPQVKLGWMTIGGDRRTREEVRARLELIADTFLSVSTPVQVAAPSLLREAAVVRAAIQARIRTNLAEARRIVAARPSCELLRAEGGWTAVIRVPAIRSEEDLVLGLLDRERILVHPGYFFDFRREAYSIVSLLPEENVFAAALKRVLAYASVAPERRPPEREELGYAQDAKDLNARDDAGTK